MKQKAIPLSKVRLLDSTFKKRYELNRRYMMSLRSENMLQNHYLEAGLWQAQFRSTMHPDHPPAIDSTHWGWESPTCQLRGHFLGHWLSAAARMFAATGDAEAKARADGIVGELARCQERNGGEWVFPIPPKYLDWIAQGERVSVPHYTLHKTLMGLIDAHAYAGNEQAIEILERAASWFHRWTAQFSREQLDDILDVETGGMLEAWADLYSITGRQAHLDLIERYDRPRLFERLLAGEDPLINSHANTTIPEAHGAARAYEVTGDARWREIAEAYWKCAVTDRGTFCTGGQTSGEVWTPPHAFAACLSDKNQEHCTVYNMMRLADYLFRWSGDVTYADYIERNLYNGILAQQHPRTGMITYYLPLEPGARKVLSMERRRLDGRLHQGGSPTDDFWCCHGSLVQAHTCHNAYVTYEDEDGLVVCQYIPTELRWEWAGVPVVVRQAFDAEASSDAPREPDGPLHRPDRWAIDLAVHCERPVEFTLRLRLPWWLSGSARLLVNGELVELSSGPSSFCEVRRTWHEDALRLELPKALHTCPLPDEPGTVAFMDGPVVLAGLCDEARTLYGDVDHPASLLVPDNERQWETWLSGYRAVNQARGPRFKPLYDIVDEPYTVYVQVRRNRRGMA